MISYDLSPAKQSIAIQTASRDPDSTIASGIDTVPETSGLSLQRSVMGSSEIGTQLAGARTLI